MVRWETPSGGRGFRVLDRFIAEGFVVAALGIWTVSAMSFPSFIVPTPWDVVKAIGQLFTKPDISIHVIASTARVVCSVTAALVLGLCIALLARNFSAIEAIVVRRMQPFFSSFPSMGWALLASIWFDFNNTSVLFVQIVILLPYSTGILLVGLREVDSEMLEMGRSFTRRSPRVFIKLTLPMLLPYVIAVLRITYGIGWKIALVSELTGVETGLGYLMLTAQSASNVAMVLATCFVIVAAFICGERLLINPLARRWRAVQ